MMLTDDQIADDATLDALEGRAKSKRSIDARWMLRLISDLRASREQVERMRGVAEAAREWAAFQHEHPGAYSTVGGSTSLINAVRAYEESDDASKP